MINPTFIVSFSLFTQSYYYYTFFLVICLFFLLKDSIGAIESVKAVSDVYCPASGTVTEVNTELESTPEVVNTSPLEDGKSSLLVFLVYSKLIVDVIYFLFKYLTKVRHSSTCFSVVLSQFEGEGGGNGS